MKKVGRPKLLAVLEGDKARPLPVWLMRQAGRYLPEYRALRTKAGSFWTLCMNPELSAEVTLQPIERFDFDAAIVFSDILTIPAALGQIVRIEEGVGPRLAMYPGNTKLGAPDMAALGPVYETLGIVRTKLAADKALIGFAGAPWTLATYMLGENGAPGERLARARAQARSGLPALLEVLTSTVTAHLAEQVRAGADVVQIFDSWAGGLNDQEFANWVIAPTKAIVSGLAGAAPKVKIIGFPRGVTTAQYATYVRETGVHGVSIDTPTSLSWALNELPNVTCQGNLDPDVLVAGGPVLDRAIESIVAASADRPFIFNLGHGVLPETPSAHVQHLVTKVRELSAP
jgi:uroporphyrinogen decarboxylase